MSPQHGSGENPNWERDRLWKEVDQLRTDMNLLKERQDRMITRFELIAGLALFFVATVVPLALTFWQVFGR